MDAQRKTLQALTASLDEKRQGLQDLYRSLGETLYRDSVATQSTAGPISMERVDSWKELMTARERDASAILDIKTALTRRQEIQQFRKELEQTKEEAEREYVARLSEIGKALHEGNGDAIGEAFADARLRASAEQAALDELERRHAALVDELERSNFFGKLIAQFKLSGSQASVRKQQERVASAFADSARPLVENGTLFSLAEKGSCDPSVVEGIRDLYEHLQRRKTLEERSTSTHAELESLQELLSKHGAADNHNRRIEELSIRVRDADRRLETLITLSAREFVDRYMDEDGMPLVRDSATVDGPFTPSGPYKDRLEECSSLRVEVSRVRKSIQSIETALRIETLDRGVLSMERTISECQRKIGALNAQVDSLTKSIDESKRERETLCALKREIDDSLT